MTASIHRRVLLWAMGALLVGAALLVGGSWWVLAHEMGEVFEDNLKQVALAVANHHGTYGVARPPRLAQQLPRVYEEYGKFEFVTAVWTRDGRRMHSSDEGVALPFLSRSGLSEVVLGGEKWHLYTIVLEDGIVQAAQRASERDSLARETATTLVFPALVLLAPDRGPADAGAAARPGAAVERGQRSHGPQRGGAASHSAWPASRPSCTC